MLYHGSKTYDSSLSRHRRRPFPTSCARSSSSGTAATQTYRNPQGTAEIVIGVPIPSVHADYFDVFDLSDLDHTLRVLALALFVAGGITTIFGIALGRFASTRSLRPLAVVSRAAGAIAAGDLDTRLDLEAADPDLEGFTLSFNAMVDQLQERIEREARFNSDVSHELRSPLTTLAAAMEVLETDREELPPRSQRALQLLSDDLRRFQRMVGDLLEMSRAEAGSVDIFLEEVQVAELVQRSVETGFGHMVARGPGPGGPPDVDVDPAVRSWRVGVDKRRFERVMVNLMENASHYGGGVTGIAVRPVPRGNGNGNANGNGNSSAATTPARRGHRRRRRPGHRSPRARQGVRTLLPGLGLGPARREHRDRIGVGARRRAHARHARRGPGGVLPRRRCPLRPHPAGAARRGRCGGRRVRRRRVGLPGVLLVAVAFLAAGCAIPTQSAPSTMAPSKVPFDLLDPHLPTTTTTLPKPSSLVPVKVFFLNSSSQLTSAPRVVAAPAPLTAIITSMLAGPTRTETGQGISTAIPSNVAVISTTTAAGIVTVNMNAAFGAITGSSIELAVAQIVATVATEVGLNTGVIFEIEGQRTSVPIANGSQVSEPVYLIEFLSVAP